ncbi:hypothetical protein [Cryptosporangium sp. NPDC051539]|uniref:hypothetical protein n=1 Tax=Cryptosporangium sp. NPDC051539 TaxID=3363962 RepID=UPI0037AC2926
MRLHGVGPDGARFDPLDLDFATRDGAAARVLLSLTNTGGKSTLITLICSVVVPAARAQIGGKNLGDYVLTGDTSHVVCEWEDSSTGVRVVTGTVMEWKDGRRQPGYKQRSITNLRRAWYLFRTGSTQPGITDLPFVVDGRRNTLESYLTALEALLAANPKSRWVVARTQPDWADALEAQTSLDPVLFSYQMRMNDSESGAEKLLATFNSADNVVRFFVAALNDDRELADFTKKLGPYAELAAQRPKLEGLAGFGGSLAPLVENVAVRSAALADAAAAALTARIAGADHATALANRVAEDGRALAELETEVTRAAEAAVKARREYAQISDIRLQLLLEQARAHLAVATEALRTRTTAATQAFAEAEAWAAVDAVLDVATARKARDSAQLAYEAADAGLGPLRDQVAHAVAALAGRLDGLVKEAGEAITAADTTVTDQEAARDRALEQEKAGDRLREKARRELSEIERATRAAEEALEAAARAGLRKAGEPPDRCEARWRAAVETAESTATEADAEADSAEADFDTTQAALQADTPLLAGLRQAADEAEQRRTAFDDSLSRLAADATVLSLLNGTPEDSDSVQRAGNLATEAAQKADARAATHEKTAREAADELAHLDEAGTAPTGPDALAVLETLLTARIGAVAGLSWIERNIPDPADRPAVIEARPDLAGGVVVLDPARFSDAVACLKTAALRTRTPVAVSSTASLVAIQSSRPGDDMRYVVVPHRATWDRDWAATIRGDLETTVTSDGAAATAARQAAQRYRSVAAECGVHAERWSGTTRADLLTAESQAVTDYAKADGNHRELVRQRDAYRRAARDNRELAAIARREQTAAEKKAGSAAELAAVTGAGAAAAARRLSAQTDLSSAQRAINTALADRQAATEAINAAVERRARARADRGAWQRQRNGLGIDAPGPDPGGNLAVVETEWTSLRDELSAAEHGLIEAEFLRRARQALADAVDRRDRFATSTILRATQLADTTEASSRESLNGAQRQAHADATAAEKSRVRAEAATEQATAAVEEAAPAASDRQNHVDLAHTDWQPETPEAIPSLLERLEGHNITVRDRRDAAEQAETDAKELHDAIATDVVAFNDTIGMWTSDRVAGDHVYRGSTTDARTRMRDLLGTYRTADDAERSARDQQRDAITAVRAAASDARWRHVDAPAAIRLRTLKDSDLIAEAAQLGRRVQAIAESAKGDLESLDTHRTILRDGLLSLCREQRRLLREVTRASRLPAGLGDISEAPAIKIRFDGARTRRHSAASPTASTPGPWNWPATPSAAAQPTSARDGSPTPSGTPSSTGPEQAPGPSRSSNPASTDAWSIARRTGFRMNSPAGKSSPSPSWSTARSPGSAARTAPAVGALPALSSSTTRSVPPPPRHSSPCNTASPPTPACNWSAPPA